MDETLNDLIDKLAVYRGTLNDSVVSQQLTWATPDWAANLAAGDIQQLAMRLCLAYTSNGVAVIPQAAKILKAAGYEIITTRDTKPQVLSVVLYTPSGQFILHWNQAVLAAYIDTVRAAALPEPGIDQPPYPRGVLGALKHLVDALKGKA